MWDVLQSKYGLYQTVIVELDQQSDASLYKAQELQVMENIFMVTINSVV